MARILVADDSESVCVQLCDLLTDLGHSVEQARDGREALDVIARGEFELLIADIWMPSMNGLELLRKVKQLRPELGVIIITAKASVETAQMAFREGAFDYVLKASLLADTVSAVNRAIDRLYLRRENRMLRKALHSKFSFERIIGDSPQMNSVYSTMRKVLFSDTTVLIMGETGTGKEMVAKAIHFNGSRCDRSFVAINCAAISPNILESELFGHERGAFTGAVTSKKGLFEEASGGTLFLDEISEMNPDLQSKLLRVLQEKEIQKVGSTRPVKIDVRVIAATHRVMKEEVDQGRFRADLFFRLNVVPINLPPLREREGDIELLARHFLKTQCAQQAKQVKLLDDSAIELLNRYPWPGNVRELENTIERAVNLCDETVLTANSFEHLQDQISPADGLKQPPFTPGTALPGPFKTLVEAEKDYILTVLDSCDGNKSKAARILGIDYSTLYRKLKRIEKSTDEKS